jgi:EF-hand domain-containing protein 1
MRYSASSPNLPGYVNNNRYIGRGRKNDPFEEKVNRSKVLQRIGSSSILNTSKTLSKNLSGTISTSSLPAYSPTLQRLQLTSSASIGELLPAPTGPPRLPNYIKNDHETLMFKAYFKEAVRESPLENWRIRKVTITYYLEDNTMKIDEVVSDNNGIWGGPFLTRRVLPNLDVPGTTLGILDLVVGKQITVFSKTFQIYGCDLRTRKYLDRRGIECLPDVPEERITDEFMEYRKDFQSRETGADLDKYRGKTMYPMKTHMEALRGRHTRPLGAEKRSFEYGAQKLSFKLAWNDKTRLYGHKKIFTLDYYLADKTCEVRQQLKKNNGQDPFPLFAKRCRLPKTDRPIADSLNIGGEEDKGPNFDDGTYYTDKDFDIGMTIKIFRRDMVLVSCKDDFTRKYMLDTFGRDMATHENILSLTTEPEIVYPTREIPPPTGYGNDEDSMGSVRKLRPTQPKRDLAKLNKMAGKTLGFMARLISKAPADQARRFVIRYFLADDTIQVYETVQANSGLVGGRFLNRMRMKRTDGKFYNQHDLNVGETVQFHAFRFEIIGMDGATSIYKNTGDHDHMASTDISAVVKKLLLKLRSSKSQLAKVFREADEDKNGLLTFSELKRLLEHLLGDSTLTDSDVAQVMLVFDMQDKDGYIDYEELAKKVFDTAGTRYESETRSHFQTIGSGDVSHGLRRKNTAEYLAHLKRSESTLQDQDKAKRALFRFIEMFEHSSTSFSKTFRKLDKDHSGEFDREEFIFSLQELQVTAEDAKFLANHYFNGKETLQLNSFMKQVSEDSVLLIGQQRKS